MTQLMPPHAGTRQFAYICLCVCVCVRARMRAGGWAWCLLFTAWSHQLTNARRCAAISALKKHLHLIASGGLSAPRLNPARRHAHPSTKSEVQARNSVAVLPVSFHRASFGVGVGGGGWRRRGPRLRLAWLETTSC